MNNQCHYITFKYQLHIRLTWKERNNKKKKEKLNIKYRNFIGYSVVVLNCSYKNIQCKIKLSIQNNKNKY